MQSLLIPKSRIVCKCYASKDQKTENAITIARKAFEKKRAVNAKENLNKVLLVADTDLKEYYNFFKELEEIHRKEFLTLHDKVVAPLKRVTGSTDEKVKTDEAVEEDDDENIFKKVE